MDMSIPIDDREMRNEMMALAKKLATQMSRDAAQKHFAEPRAATSWHGAHPGGPGYLRLHAMLQEKLDSPTTTETINGIIEREFDGILLEATRRMMVRVANKAAWTAAQKNGRIKVGSERVLRDPDSGQTMMVKHQDHYDNGEPVTD